MDNKIALKAQEIINDLINLDPSLKPLKNELEKLVIEFIKNKPEPVIDEKFTQELKSVLVDKIRELKQENTEEKLPFNKTVFLKKLSLSLGAVLLALIIIIPTINSLDNQNVSVLKDNILEPEIKITRLDDGAFGEINIADAQMIESQTDGRGSNFINPSINPEASLSLNEASKINSAFTEEMDLAVSSDVAIMDISETKMISPAVGISIPGMGSDMDISIMPNFEYPTFSYIYEGDDLKEVVSSNEKVDVYKKAKNEFNSSSLLSFITNINTNLINLKKFDNKQTKVSYFNVNEEKEFGYVLGFDASNNSFSLYQNWQYWPQIGAECRNEACFARVRFNYSDLLSNEAAINIAKNFLTDYGINQNGYGEASVNYNFHETYASSNNKTELYVPEETTVVFPFIIEGKEVKDESGQSYGLYVNVNSRHKKVSGFNNLTPNHYEVSAYDAFTDVEKIKSIVENGGLNFYKDPYATKEIKVYLGTPSIILSRQYQYSENYENSVELFVPALSFPVLRLSEETEYYYQKNIVIPLVKDLIKENQSGGAMPYPIEAVMR